MNEISSRIEIDAPPERVWEVVMDPWRLGEWVHIHRDLHDPPDGELHEGTEFGQTLRLGRSFKVRWRVAHLDRPNEARWEGRGPAGSRAQVTYRLVAADGGTRFDYENRFELPAIGWAIGRLFSGGPARKVVRSSLQDLKEVVESDGQSSPG